MKVQTIKPNYQQNKPNFKALYFTKTQPMRSKRVDYINQKITDMGVKFVEDTSHRLTPAIKEAFAENNFIKKLVDKCDVFVSYIPEYYNSYVNEFSSSAVINVVRKENDLVLSDRYGYNSYDKYTPDGARLKLLSKIETNQPSDKEAIILGE